MTGSAIRSRGAAGVIPGPFWWIWKIPSTSSSKGSDSSSKYDMPPPSPRSKGKAGAADLPQFRKMQTIVACKRAGAVQGFLVILIVRPRLVVCRIGGRTDLLQFRHIDSCVNIGTVEVKLAADLAQDAEVARRSAIVADVVAYGQITTYFDKFRITDLFDIVQQVAADLFELGRRDRRLRTVAERKHRPRTLFSEENEQSVPGT